MSFNLETREREQVEKYFDHHYGQPRWLDPDSDGDEEA